MAAVANGEQRTKETNQTISKELKVFRGLRPTMMIAYGQEGVLSRLALSCFSAHIIDHASYSKVTDAHHSGEAERAQLFILKIYERIVDAERNGRLRDAVVDIKNFATVIREVDSTYEHIAKEIERYTCSSDLLENIIHLSDALHSGLSRISTHAMSSDLITYHDHTYVVDSSGQNCELRTIALFNALDRHFEINPQDLKNKFIPLLTSKMDDTSNMAVRFLEALK